MTVTRFSPTGRFVWRLGGPSETTPDLIGHEHFADVDAGGRLVMANDDLGKIVYVGVDGRELDAFGEGSGGYSTGTRPAAGDFPNGACDVAVDAAGYTVVNSCQDPSSPTHDTELFDASISWWARGMGARSPFHLVSDRTVRCMRSRVAERS